MKNSEEDLPGGVEARDAIEYEQRVESEEFKETWREEKLRNWKGKNMHGQYLRDMPHLTDFAGTREWLSS